MLVVRALMLCLPVQPQHVLLLLLAVVCRWV
jgi:hypothetical protein